MIYNEYIKFAKHRFVKKGYFYFIHATYGCYSILFNDRSSIFQNYNKTVVMKAFEQLIELELVMLLYLPVLCNESATIYSLTGSPGRYCARYG